MRFKNTLKSILTQTCVYYSCLTLLIILLNLIMGGKSAALVGVVNFLLIFPFGFSLSLANLVTKSEKLSHAAGMFLHYLITMSAFLLFLWLPTQNTPSITQALIAAFLITVLYWLCVGITKLTVKRFRSYREE